MPDFSKRFAIFHYRFLEDAERRSACRQSYEGLLNEADACGKKESQEMPTIARETAVNYRRRAERGMLRLSGAAGIADAGAIHAAALRAAQDSEIKSVRIELEHVARLDASILQVVCALSNELRRQEKTLEITGASGAMMQALSPLALTG